VPPSPANRDWLFGRGRAFLEELGKQPLLVGNMVYDSRFVFSAGNGGGLLGELSDLAYARPR